MSKRHQQQPSQELRPPPARAARAAPARATSPRTTSAASTTPRRRHRATASRSWTRAPRASATRSAIDGGRLPGCAPAHHRPAAPPAGRASRHPRRRRCRVAELRSAVRARRGPSRLAVLLAAIVIAFAAAFFSLSQDIRVSATGYEMDRLAIDQQRLQAQADDLRNELNRLGKAPGDPQVRDRRRPRAASRTRNHPGALGAPDRHARPDRFPRPRAARPRRLRAGGGQPRRAARVLAGRAVATSCPRWRSSSRRCATRSRPTRGSIYDRTGTVVLATSVDARPAGGLSQAADPGAPRRRSRRGWSTILGLEGDAAAELTTRMPSEREYVVLARDLDPAMSDQIRDRERRRQPGARRRSCSSREPVRVYPQPGGGPEHDARRARPRLRQPRRRPASTASSSSTRTSSPACRASSPRRRTPPATPCPTRRPSSTPGYPGQDLTLTLDASLQVAVEQELLAAWIADRAKRVSAVVMDPYTRRGRTPTRATRRTTPTTTRRSPRTTPEPVRRPDRVDGLRARVGVQDAHGDGRDRPRHASRPRPRLTDTGKLWVDGGRAHVDDADHLAHGPDDVPRRGRLLAQRRRREGRARSSGTDTRESSRILYDTWRRMGFGTPTGIDVANEVPGIVRDPAVTPWREIDLANGAFGQGIAVTPIQLAQAYSAMVNGGTLVQPRVVSSIGDAETHPVYEGRVMPASLSKTLQRADAARHHQGRLLPRPDAHPGLRGRRQDGHGADLGRGQEAPGRSTSSTTRSSGTSGARPATPTSSSRCGSRRGRPPSSASATWRCP